MLTFFFAAFNVYRDVFKKRDASLLLYVAEKDRCTVRGQFYNNVRQIECEKRVFNYEIRKIEFLKPFSTLKR